MRYIKIRGNNYNEAMMKLKMEHGDDAIPISHKYVKEGGFFNSKLFAKDVVELTAAVQERKSASKILSSKGKIDYTVGDRQKKERVLNDTPADAPSGKKDDFSMDSISRTIDVLNDNLNGFKAEQKNKVEINDNMTYERTEKNPPVENKTGTPEAEASIIKNFEKEFTEIKKTLERLVNERDGERGVQEHEQEQNCKEDNDAIDEFVTMLKHNDYDAEACNVMINEVKNSMTKDDIKNRFAIEKTLKDLLKSRIVTTGPVKKGSRKKIVMFIGPTGVGKTTTMAKLGAINSLREGQKVSFVTIDNYRIAATEQLKKYAEIMDIPVHAVNDQKDFKEVIASEKAELIMVDTSGRSHRNDLKISEIKSFADQIEYDFEKVLCVSANTKKMDLNDVFRVFNNIEFDSVIITKVDETSFIGNVVDIADKYNKPISYFTNGQEVPNDIVVADPDKIVDMMMGNINN